MLKTYQNLFQFVSVARAYLAENKSSSPLTDSLKTILVSIDPLFQRYSEAMEDLRINFCSADEDGNVLRDQYGNYKFTRDALILLRRAHADLLLNKIEVKPCIATEVPADLPVAIKEAFYGYVL